ncbi:16S rRNA (cytosine(1402)-N(4))-methyltransferase RsmH [Neptunomonas antarctica]|uniref:Ribosomal RNA small subunit methyltransferase H n=1 Tax=Neptunomonas antarctica TaxID=619304 RepID=A0A1N7PFM1_9GAMM|nr:16S rRNA (cytosine(1402)-N(4))-methyltransferase RsmH [Neptunomonas antarctica]SIT09392.1 16S rRNA (cytosine1402-N4)-methyltransferase [Neptunomonas antarctica]
MSTETLQHITVLLDEAVAALVQNPDGFYIDGTFGRGGHSDLILKQLSSEGRLMAIDKDLEAITCAHTRFADDARFEIAHGSFSELQQFVTDRDMFGKVDGVLLDLGVSSPQLDDPSRGFSFQNSGPLDMRMDTTSGQSAAEWIKRASQDEIADVIYTYGEERHGRRMAKAIIEARAIAPIETTAQLAKIITDANASWEKGKHPATRAFQAIRIHVNRELEDLEKCLDQSLDSLKVGGRLVIISFHSLEDRIAKRFIRKHVKGDDHLPMSIPITTDMLNQRLKAVGKMVKASSSEVDINPRSRSAVMRIATKIA